MNHVSRLSAHGKQLVNLIQGYSTRSFFYNDSHKEMSYTIRGIGLSTYLASSASTVTDKCRRSGPSTSTRNSVAINQLFPTT
jgi:hypothetical protein